MIDFIKRQLLEAARELRIEVTPLGSTESMDTRRALAQQFCVQGTPTLHWNCLRDYSAVQHPDSWQWIKEFLGDEAVFLLPDEMDEPTVFGVEHGSSVSDLLGECSHFVFYVASRSSSYLVCQNQHDFLFGAGTAKPWVDSLQSRHREWVASLPDRDA
jgi:hypothetical protein